MIVGKQHDHEVGKIPFLLELLQLIDENPGPVHVRHGVGEPDVVGTNVRSQGLQLGHGANLEFAPTADEITVNVQKLAIRLDFGAHELTVVAECEPFGQDPVPQESRAGVRERVAAVVRVATGEIAELLFKVVGDVGLIRPLVSVRAQNAAAVEIVQQHKLLGQRVVVGRNFPAKMDQAAVAVSLRHVAQNLVVRPIFFDDVDDVFEDRTLTRPCRNGYRLPRRRSGVLRACNARTFLHRARVLGQPVRVRDANQRNRAEVVVGVVPGALRPGIQRAQALDVGDKEKASRPVQNNGTRVPPRRDEPPDHGVLVVGTRVASPQTQLDHGNRVVGAVCHVERGVVRTHRQRVRSAAKRQLRTQPHVDVLDHSSTGHVDYRHQVAVGVRHVQPAAVHAEGQAARVQPHVHLGNLASLTQIHEGNRPAGGHTRTRVHQDRRPRSDGGRLSLTGNASAPVRHKGRDTVRADNDVVRSHAHRDFANRFRGQIDDCQRVVAAQTDEQAPAVQRQGNPSRR